MGAFIQQLPEIHNMLYPNGCEGNEFISRVKVLRELDAFTIDLRDKDVVYICDNNFDTVLKVLKTNIKKRTSANLFKSYATSIVSYLRNFLSLQSRALHLFSQKAKFKKVYIGECNFTEDQVRELRAEVKAIYGGNIEIVDENPLWT